MSMMTSVPRSEARRAFEAGVRIQLLEGDADTFERTVQDIRSTLSRIQWISVSALISFTTSAIVLAFTIANSR